ncbi:hypothetical protein J437_LFUL003116 [Ladona fulva]|uniref:Uncharacterized protein n=1 Tax=Ladona fulva TaxID=123851 RepID=A0A8K0JWR1_LADFU|nr:hypothetical protein J437_LFUL003116 [Ladona fulva]
MKIFSQKFFSRRSCPFSWEWLQKELASKDFFAFAISSTIIAVLADPEDVFDMDNMTEESMNDMNPLIKLSRGKCFQERFQGLIDDFIESGFFH